ncbi:hypothetical protein P692DRAFT_201868442 [Suillus brevipes Sb2]|nr:hypothetical protein P692DRAFT_201868442 [Suillus brevipes Sb2]
MTVLNPPPFHPKPPLPIATGIHPHPRFRRPPPPFPKHHPPPQQNLLLPSYIHVEREVDQLKRVNLFIWLVVNYFLFNRPYGHHYPSPPKPAFPPPNSSYITPPTLPDTPSPGYSTSTSTASTASPLTPPASSSPGIPKHEPVPVPPPLKHKMFAFASPLDLPPAR